MKYVVAVQVIKVYHIIVEARSGQAAAEQVGRMQTTEIAERGSLKDVETDHIEVVS